MKLATRSSRLALWQAETTQRLLRATHPQMDVELVHVKSSGDIDQKSALERFGRIGIFTAEVDQRLIAGEAQVGVHSLKDMTTTLQDGLVLAGVLARGPVEDVLIARDGESLEELPQSARVATGSLRRSAMLRRLRPDLKIVGIRGNVETRLAKLAAGEADALLMARAGMVRLGFEAHITQVIGVDAILPAVGQGMVGLTCREGDEVTARNLRAIGDPDAWAMAHAERALLRSLHGGCNVPAGGHARVVENTLHLEARVLSLDGSQEIKDELSGSVDEAEAIGQKLAERLLERGAAELVDAARS